MVEPKSWSRVMFPPSTKRKSAKSMLRTATALTVWDASSSTAKRMFLVLPNHKPPHLLRLKISLFLILTLPLPWRIRLILPHQAMIAWIRAAKTFLKWSISKINRSKTNKLFRKSQQCKFQLPKRPHTPRSWSTASTWVFRSNRKSSRCTRKRLRRKWVSNQELKAPAAVHQISSIWTYTRANSKDSDASETSSSTMSSKTRRSLMLLPTRTTSTCSARNWQPKHQSSKSASNNSSYISQVISTLAHIKNNVNILDPELGQML